MRRLLLVLLLALGSGGLLAACGGDDGGGAAGATSGAEVSDVELIPVEDREPAQGFSVGALDGDGVVSLDSLRGSPVILNFWASWCAPCERETPDLVAFAKAHPDVKVVGVATNDAAADSRAFAKRHDIPYTLASDPDGEVGNLYGIPGLPATYILDAEGNLAAAPWFGPIERKDLDAFAAALGG